MSPKLLQAVLVDVFQHGCGAASHFPAFQHAFEFPAAVGFGLAFHVVVIEGAAAGADKVGGG